MANTYDTARPGDPTFDDTGTGAGSMLGDAWNMVDEAAPGPAAGSSDTIVSTMNGVAAGLLPGTLIDTPFGARAIETLSPGDLVTVVEGGRHASRMVRRVGRDRMDTALAADPAAACPVRIRRHAFADNLPSRDLLVTSAQGIHVAGRSIPARMLVNGTSIVSDTAIAAASFVRLELDRPAILLAEGLETGSALDGGARRHARQAGEGMASCVDRTVVEPIRARLADRARRFGLGTTASASLPPAPGLHLRTADGATIAPVLCDGAVYAFVVPEGATGLRLVGRCFGSGTLPDDRGAPGMVFGSLGLEGIDNSALSTLHLVNGAPAESNAPEQAEIGCWPGDDGMLLIESGSGPMVLVVEVPAVGSHHACGNA